VGLAGIFRLMPCVDMWHFCHTFGMTPALPALPDTFAIARGWGAVAVVVVAGSAFVITTYRRGRPLRREMRERPLTFAARVDVRGFNYRGFRGTFDLIVHGDMFEVSAVPLPGLLGDQWIYRARDTTMEVVPGRRHELIKIAWLPTAGRGTSKVSVLGNLGGPLGEVVAVFCALSPVGPAPIRIRGRKGMNPEIWDALVRAGVHPVGDPPQ
jgi:hypothetical protein